MNPWLGSGVRPLHTCLFPPAGSGDLAALGILEDGYKPDLELDKAKELVRAAIHAGVMNDLASGNNIDICVLTREGVDYIRPYQVSQYKDKRYECD
uniref:proteasome 20S subunit beta 13a n=1 Tax=Gasterosteus aculeatus aculeatus TaxID=481459 RepID=UPI001A983D30|nr:proteasome 20S subunit beta 13a [Gasterosteus aculeatus aculeatus]